MIFELVYQDKSKKKTFPYNFFIYMFLDIYLFGVIK
jgi:hypothetical protein